MQKDRFDRIISFLLGASWAILIFGALITFQIFLFLGISLSLFITIMFIVFALFLILLLDAFSINRQRLEEAKKHTDILQKIESQHTKEV